MGVAFKGASTMANRQLRLNEGLHFLHILILSGSYEMSATIENDVFDSQSQTLNEAEVR